MENFCLYNGKKIVKPEIWDITSIELSSDYTSAIIQAESKVSTSQHTLDITQLISNQYKNGINPYTATVVSSLTGVSDWILDSDNNQIRYTEPNDSTSDPRYLYRVKFQQTEYHPTKEAACLALFSANTSNVSYTSTNTDCEIKRPTWDQPNKIWTYPFESTVNSDYVESEPEEKSIPLDTVVQQVISNANSGDVAAQNSIISTFNNMIDGLLNYDYSEFFESNKQPK